MLEVITASMPQRKARQSKRKTCYKIRARGTSDRPTSVILQAVDERLAAQNDFIKEELAVQEVRILAAVDKRLEKLEERFMEKLNELTTTLDKFLKRLTAVEQEFKFLKVDLKRASAKNSASP